MKIEKTETLTLYTGRCHAALKMKEQNEVVKNLLKQIQSGGIESFKNNPELQFFAQGLIKSLKNEGFLDKNGSLTDEGKEVCDSGNVFKRLEALFSIDFVEHSGRNYLLECKIASKNENAKAPATQNIALPGKFLDAQYEVSSNHKLEVKDFSLKNPSFLLEKEKEVTVNASYDFESKVCNTSVKGEREVYTFETNDENKFKIIGTSLARSVLREKLESNCGNAFSVGEDCTVSLISCNSAQKKLIWRYLKKIFERASFDYSTKDNYQISGIKVDLAESAKKDVLLGYLQDISEKTYLSKDNIGFFAERFPSFFKTCPQVKESNETLFEDLLSNTSTKSKLRLNAVKDLTADTILKDYETERAVIDFSTRKMSWQDFVDEVFDYQKDIKSVKTLCKFTSSNKAICKGLSLISAEIQKKFGTKLSVITSIPQGKSNQASLQELKTTCDCIEKNENDIKNIHDRYWKITFSDDSCKWFKASAEVDALHYESDFRSAFANTVGNVREFTISFISEDGVSSSIKKLFEL